MHDPAGDENEPAVQVTLSDTDAVYPLWHVGVHVWPLGIEMLQEAE